MRNLLDKVFVGLALIGLLGGGLGTAAKYVLTRGGVSFYENRALAAAPELSWDGLWTGDTMQAADGFISDYFPGRSRLLRTDTRLNMALGRPVVNDLVMDDTLLLPFHPYNRWELGYLRDLTSEMAAGLAPIDDAVRAHGGRLFYLGLPHHTSYFEDRYPSYMDNRAWQMDELRTQFASAMAAEGLTFLDAGTYFHELGDPEEYYSLSDHHYTAAGMLAAYRYLMEGINAGTGLGLRILTEDDLELTELPNPFLGSYNRQLFGCWPESELLTTVELKEGIPFRRWDNGEEVPAAVNKLPETDGDQVTYEVYMGGDIGETIIRTERPELPKLLIWGDSFTNAMETVLWASFDETRSLDYRHYDGKDLTAYIAEYEPDVVVCIRDDTAYLDTNGNGAVR